MTGHAPSVRTVEPPDAAVVGGGLVGCLTARALAGAGLTVRLLEAWPALGRKASTAAAGMLSPQMEAAEDLLVEVPDSGAGRAMLELCLTARDRYPAFVEGIEVETSRGVHYRTDGTLVVALTQVEAGRLVKTAEAQQARGLRAELLDGADVHRFEPGVTERAAAALHLPDDHQVDPVALMEAVMEAVRASARIQLVTGTTVRSVVSRSGRVAAVETTDDELPVPLVVLAAGAWSGRIEGLPRPLPVRPVKGQMAALRPERPPIQRTVGGRGAYCVPREDGRVVVGATVEERGFDARVSRTEIDALVATATEYVPELEAAETVSRWAGLRPGTADSLPVVGADPELQGLLYATGHYRNGILLAPLTAECITALAVGGKPPVDLSPFAPDRPSLIGWPRPVGTGREA